MTEAATPMQMKRHTGLLDWLTTVDHKKIGLMYFWFTFIMGIVGGALAGMIRIQLASPGAIRDAVDAANLGGADAPFALFGPDGLLSANIIAYNEALTMHASVMIFFVVIPAFAAFGNYIVPLMIGARDMAFPKLNAFAFWLLIPAAVLMFSSFFVHGGAAQSGWTAYPPLSLQGGIGMGGSNPGQDMWVLGVHLAGLSSILGAINFVVTISNMRAPGMTWMKMPLFAWAVFITSLLQIIATPVLGAAVTMILLDRNFGTHFVQAQDGDPALYQHIFWFYSHPAVYIMILPGFGAISHIFAALSRKRIFGYTGMVFAIASIGFIGFAVWAHHMFTIGMPTGLQAYFMLASFAIAVPTGIKVFSWLATLWGGKIRFEVPMLYGLGFIFLFVLGGFGGLILAIVPVDTQLHDSYFVVGHFHYTLVGGSTMLLMAMTFFWWPKMTGRKLSHGLGVASFWLFVVGIFLAFGNMHIAGMVGMARRVEWYREEFMLMNHISTLGWLLTFVAAICVLIAIIRSLLRKPDCGNDPWGANEIQPTFEWATTSPPPVYNFEEVPPIPIDDPKGSHH